MSDFKSIVVAQGNPVIITSNPTEYPLIGRGLQGAVFKLSNNRCVKIYSKAKYWKQERNVLQQAGQELNILPKVYEIGPKYIVMEYLNGPSLQEYLETTRSISKGLTNQLLFLLSELTRAGFLRIDFALRHTIFAKDGNLKIIDHVNSFKVYRTYPKRLLKDLKQLGLLESFLEQVKIVEPELYQKWKPKC